MGDDVDQVWHPVKGRRRPDNKGQQQRIDIATAKNLRREENVNLTTFFFTDFPRSFGALAMFNAFQYYGEIVEVVIPAKLDKGGRRFGFARFNNVADARRFAIELDSIIIGRDKISVNQSRYNRSKGVARFDEWREGRKARKDSGGAGDRKGGGASISITFP
ncbi:zinc finger CCCH domain-containing protein [Trifolium repens]|nr:zinc finger CCCH domain-containing protein [Trifolium repens]